MLYPIELWKLFENEAFDGSSPCSVRIVYACVVCGEKNKRTRNGNEKKSIKIWRRLRTLFLAAVFRVL